MPKSKEMISDSESGSVSASSEEEAKVKSKPKKQEKKKEKLSESDNSESEQESKAKKRGKKNQADKGSNKKVKKDTKSNDDDETTWDLGGKKQINVRYFKGKWFVDIREMYMDKDCELKPTKKGICLNIENWRELVKVVDEVDKCVKSKC